MKRILSAILSLLMLCTLLPTTALAEETTPATWAEVLSDATELTDGFNESVTLSGMGNLSMYSGEEAILPYKTFSFKNTNEHPVEATISACGTEDMLLYICKTDELGTPTFIERIDHDMLSNNGEITDVAFVAGEEIFFVAASYSPDIPVTATVTFSVSDEIIYTPKDLLANATPMPTTATTVTLSNKLVDSYGYSYYSTAFTAKNNTDRPKKATFSAYSSGNLFYYVFKKDETGTLRFHTRIDEDHLDNGGEEYTFAIPAGTEYLFIVVTYDGNADTTATVEFSVSDGIFHTVEEMFASATPLPTTPVTVTLADAFVNEKGYPTYGKAFTAKVTDDGDLPWVLTALADDDVYVDVYAKEDGSYEFYERCDTGILPNYGEAWALEADVEYAFIVCPYDNTEDSLDATLSLVIAKSEEDFIKDAIPVTTYPFTASPNGINIYCLNGTLYVNAPYAIEMKEGDTLLLSTTGDYVYNDILCKDEEGYLQYKTDFSIDNYDSSTPLANVFRADADDTYYFPVGFAEDLTFDYFTGTYVDDATGPEPTHIKFLHYFNSGEIGGPAGTYYGDQTCLTYTIKLKKDQVITSTSSFNGEPCAISVYDENGKSFGSLYPMELFTAPEDGTYTLELWLPYTKTPVPYGVELYGVEYLPTPESLMDGQEFTTYPNGSNTIATGQFSFNYDYLTYMNAFAFNLDAGKTYSYTLDPTESEPWMYLYRKADGEDGGYELLTEGYDAIMYTPEVDERVYLVVETRESESFRFFSKEYIDGTLDFSNPNDLPTPGEEDLWSWDPYLNTLTLKDGFSSSSAYNPFILPQDAVILIDGFVTIESAEDTLVGYNLTIRGKNPAGDPAAPMDKLTIVSGSDAIDTTYLKLEDLILDIKADSDGMYVGENMSVENCSITIESGDEGIDCDNFSDEETGEHLGACDIYNSTLTITSPTEEAIDVDSLLLSNCVTTLTAGEDADVEEDAYEAIDAEVEVVIDGGELTAISYVSNVIDAPLLTVKNGAKLKLETLAANHGYAALGVDELIYDGNALMKDGVYVTASFGDINMNDSVAAEDALTALQIATSKLSADNAESLVADVDGNGVVNANDALLILQYATKKITFFPADAPTNDPDQGIGSGDGVPDSIRG